MIAMSDVIKTLTFVRDDLQTIIFDPVVNKKLSDDSVYNYICNHIRLVPNPHKTKEIIEATIKCLKAHKPTESLFPEIYNNEHFIRDARGLGDDPAWWLYGYDDEMRNELRHERIKYLNLLMEHLLNVNLENIKDLKV